MNHPLNILYEDNQILVCEKPSGIAVQSRRIGTADMESLLKNHIFREGNGQRPPYLAVIHRLDQPVRGILVFAENTFQRKRAKPSTDRWFLWKILLRSGGRRSTHQEDTLKDYMIKNGRTNLSSICAKDQPGAKTGAPYLPYGCTGRAFLSCTGCLLSSDRIGSAAGHRTPPSDSLSAGSPWLSACGRRKIQSKCTARHNHLPVCL